MKSVILIVYTTVVISIHVTRINAILGSTVTLECEDSQNQKITWRGPYKGNTIYAETNNINTNLPEDLHSRVFITIADDTKKSYLRIVDVRISDQGTYTCSNDTNQIGAFNLVLPEDVVTKDNIFYGLFTSGTGIPTSAICAFKLSEIDIVFNGPFKTQANSSFIWTQATSVPTPRPGQCTIDSMSTPDDVLTFIGEHPLMHESVQPLYDKPIFVLNNEELQILTLHDDMSDLVFYAASNTGKVYKLFSKDEETYVSSTYSPTQNSEVIWSMQQYNDSLYIGTDYLVRQIKIINCEQYRWIDSCVKDPHCAWINNGSLLNDTSIDMEIQCYNRCRSLTFVRKNGLVNNQDVYTHDNYNQSQREYHLQDKNEDELKSREMISIILLGITSLLSIILLVIVGVKHCKEKRKMQGPPAKPKYMQIIAVHATTIEIRWVAGFNGGVNQTCVLEYRLSKTTSWNTFYPKFSGLEEDPQYFELSGLSSGNVYDIQMYARNTVGNSPKTDIISVSTIGAATVPGEWTIRDKIFLFLLLVLVVITSLLIIILEKNTVKKKKEEKKRLLKEKDKREEQNKERP